MSAPVLRCCPGHRRVLFLHVSWHLMSFGLRACVCAPCVRAWQLGRPDVDVQFFMYEREQQLSDADRERARRAKIMSVADRVRFEARQEACDGHVLGAMENLALFWGELSSPMPSAHRLDRLGGRLLRNTNAACAAFDELLRLNPASIRTMLSYAEFLSEVGDPRTVTGTVVSVAR